MHQGSTMNNQALKKNMLKLITFDKYGHQMSKFASLTHFRLLFFPICSHQKAQNNSKLLSVSPMRLGLCFSVESVLFFLQNIF